MQQKQISNSPLDNIQGIPKFIRSTYEIANVLSTEPRLPRNYHLDSKRRRIHHSKSWSSGQWNPPKILQTQKLRLFYPPSKFISSIFMDLKNNPIIPEKCVSVTSTLNDHNRSFKSTLLYLIKRCRPKPPRLNAKTPSFEKETHKVLEEMESWKKKHADIEKYVSKLAVNNEKVIEDNSYLRLELKKTRLI